MAAPRFPSSPNTTAASGPLFRCWGLGRNLVDLVWAATNIAWLQGEQGRLKAGDLLWYELANGQVILRKSPAAPVKDDPFGAFDEWRSPADQEAYGQL